MASFLSALVIKALDHVLTDVEPYIERLIVTEVQTLSEHILSYLQKREEGEINGGKMDPESSK